jgi:hypothetical protein
MDKLRLRLMHKCAIERLADAELLFESDPQKDRRYDSDYLLKLLGLELLLKFILEIETPKNSRNYSHFYEKLFEDIPQETQTRLQELSGKHVGPSGFVSDPIKILSEWGKNFIALRYPYERYEGMDESRHSTLSTNWLNNGANLEDAKFRFHPEELTGLLYAAQVIANEHALQHFGASFVHDYFCIRG